MGRAALAATVSAGTMGCGPDPSAGPAEGYRARALTQIDGALTVRVSVLSAEESRQLFGAPLADKGIQPVWLHVHNAGSGVYMFLPREMDRNYYTPLEAAYRFHSEIEALILAHGVLMYFFLPALATAPYYWFQMNQDNSELDARFERLGLESAVVRSGDSISGFVLTTLDLGVKEVSVELIGASGLKRFQFFADVPGPTMDYETVNFGGLYPADSLQPVDAAALRDALAAMPCCTTSEKGTANGEVLNIALIGTLHDVLDAFASLGWTETEPMSFAAAVQSARSLFLGRPYHYMPVMPQYHAGRHQDFALQRTRRSSDERLHMRLWYTPLRYGGQPVWVGQVNRDIGVRVTFRTWNLTTHNADPEVDGARDDVVAGLLGAGLVAELGYVGGVGAATLDHPRHNLTGDPYYTDGYRAVAVLSDSSDSVRLFDWKDMLGDAPGD